jgi:hypothetical protein
MDLSLRTNYIHTPVAVDIRIDDVIRPIKADIHNPMPKPPVCPQA